MTTPTREEIERAIADWSGDHGEQIKTLIAASRMALELMEDSRRFKNLRHLMGYVQDGSQDSVTLFQDDATSDYFVKVGKQSFFGTSLNEAIDKAIDAARRGE